MLWIFNLKFGYFYEVFFVGKRVEGRIKLQHNFGCGYTSKNDINRAPTDQYSAGCTTGQNLRIGIG